ncbi:hypothetical protein N8504_05575 [Akkermansiaceae bacterium]|nr:hypothetical protein [Akkermansiaceae bacterium]
MKQDIVTPIQISENLCSIQGMVRYKQRPKKHKLDAVKIKRLDDLDFFQFLMRSDENFSSKR